MTQKRDDDAGDNTEELLEVAQEQQLMGRADTLVAGLWNTAQMVIPLVGTTIVSIAIGRILGPTELGEQSWISYIDGLMAAILVQTLVRAGIQTMATARGANETLTYEAMNRWVMWGQIAGGTIAALVLLVFAAFSEFKLAWLLVSATAAVNAIGWAYSVRIIAGDGWAPVAKRRLITQILAQAIAVVAVVVGFGIAGVFAANLVAAAILTVMIWRIAEPASGPMFPKIPRQLVHIWGLYLVTELLVQVVARRIEFFFLAAFSTKDQLAMYSIPYMVITSVTMIPHSMVTAVLPSMASQAGAGKGDVVDRHLSPAIRVIAMMSVPLAAGIAVLGPRLVTTLYGQDFKEAGYLVSWMALLVLFIPVFDLLNVYWGGYGRLGIPIVAVAIGGVLDVALAFALVEPYGAFGATIANVSGQGLAAIVLIVVTRRKLPSLNMAWGKYAAIVLVSLFAAACGWYIQEQLDGVLGWLLALVVMLAVLAAYGLTAGFTTDSDAGWLQDSVPAKLQPALRLYCGRAGRATATPDTTPDDGPTNDQPNE